MVILNNNNKLVLWEGLSRGSSYACCALRNNNADVVTFFIALYGPCFSHLISIKITSYLKCIIKDYSPPNRYIDMFSSLV